jgi:DNA-binding CsgD family transcriptional regulator
MPPLSPRLHQPEQVEYHLPKVFRKLGVKSGTQLASRV